MTGKMVYSPAKMQTIHGTLGTNCINLSKISDQIPKPSRQKIDALKKLLSQAAKRLRTPLLR